MQKRQFIANVGDIRKSFTEYREQLQALLIKSYTIETELVNRVVGLQSMLYNLHCDIQDGKIQDGKI